MYRSNALSRVGVLFFVFMLDFFCALVLIQKLQTNTISPLQLMRLLETR